MKKEAERARQEEIICNEKTETIFSSLNKAWQGAAFEEGLFGQPDCRKGKDYNP